MKEFDSDYICYDCGIKYGKAGNGVHTSHMSQCGVCGRQPIGVMHQRAYGYPLTEKNGFVFKEEK